MQVNIWASKAIAAATAVARIRLGMLGCGLCGGAVVTSSANLFGLIDSFGLLTLRAVSRKKGESAPVKESVE